jgi:hypothetical protein
LLIVVSAIRFAYGIFAQSQGHIALVGSDRMVQWFDAAGIDRAHLLDKRENAVKLVEGFAGLGFIQVELREAGQAFNVVEVE